MKHYITIFCSFALSAVLIFLPSAHAASFTPSASTVTQTRAVLTSTYYPGQDSTDIVYGDYVEYTYETDVNFVLTSIPVDSYINGYCRVTYTPTISVPTGYTLQGINTYTDPVSLSDSLFSYGYRPASNTDARLWLYCIFDNYFTHTTNAGSFTAHVSFSITKPYTGSNLTDPPEYITVSNSVSIGQSSLAATVEPQDMGMCHIISTAIINAMNDIDNPIQDLLTYIQNTNRILTDIYNHNEQWYSTIVDELLANNQWNSTITDELIALYQELSINTNATINIASYTADLRSFMQTFPTWSAQMLQLLGKLSDMSAAEQTEAAAIASQYDSLQHQQDDANAVVKAVPRPTFSASQFDSGNMVDTTQRQNFTGLLSLIVGNGYITRIFIIVITFATAGFILFGKKK